MKKIYFANGLFSEADLQYNKTVVSKIRELGFDVYLPQENDSINDKTKCADSIAIYNGDTEKLIWADILIAVLDGQSVDAGVASEIGWIAGYNETHDEKKTIIGLLTDTRDGRKSYLPAKNELLRDSIGECQYQYVNLYTVGAVKKYGTLVGSSSELLDLLEEKY